MDQDHHINIECLKHKSSKLEHYAKKEGGHFRHTLILYSIFKTQIIESIKNASLKSVLVSRMI